MALTTTEKGERVLRFLFGLRNTRILGMLAMRGFGQAELEEGWQLLRAAGRARGWVPGPMPADRTVVGELDRWENHWFAVADATLGRHHAAVRERLFLNLSQTEGLGVILSVGTFIERLGSMKAGTDGFGSDGAAARELLVKRGLDDAAVTQAQALLTMAGSPATPAEPVSLEEQKAQAEQAERAMWDWYLEWSAIARTVLEDRRMLRELGFLSKRAGLAAEEAEEPAAAPEPSAAPVVAPTA